MKKQRVLFVSTSTGARSLIAEKFTSQMAAGRVSAYSSSFEFGEIHPLAISVMKEIGIDLPEVAPKSVWDRYAQGETFDWVVTLSDETSIRQDSALEYNVDLLYGDEAKRLSWSVPAFDSWRGSTEERLAGARKIRGEIKGLVTAFLLKTGIGADIA
jgi:arsenate reductase (thioredoxin)